MKRYNSQLAMFFAFLVPGAGHLYLGKRGRAITFFLIVMAMFIVGLLIDVKLYRPQSGQPLATLAAFGSMGAGLPYFIARFMRSWGDVGSITYEYGSAFTLTAGLMNLLLMLDAFDIAEERKN
jgi:hypothetical protein